MATACGKLDEAPGCVNDPPSCVQNVLQTCDEDDQPIEVPCPEDTRCAQDAPIAQCVPVTATPCEPNPDPLTCESGLQVMCPEETGYLTQVPCESGYICAGDQTPQCVELVAVTCSPQTFPSLCVDGRRIICSPDNNRLLDDGDCAAG